MHFVEPSKPFNAIRHKLVLARAVLPNMVGDSPYTSPLCIKVQGPALGGLELTRAAIAT